MSKSSSKTVIRGLTATSYLAVTPDNAIDLPGGPCSGFWVGASGNIRLLSEENDDVTFVAVPIGPFPIGGKRVMAAGTTATSLVALY